MKSIMRAIIVAPGIVISFPCCYRFRYYGEFAAPPASSDEPPSDQVPDGGLRHPVVEARSFANLLDCQPCLAVPAPREQNRDEHLPARGGHQAESANRK